jgi:hypothetical protein
MNQGNGGGKGSFEEMVELKRKEALERIRNLRIAVLIWGPSPDSDTPIGRTRRELRNALESDGHHVRFSEDYYKPSSEFSVVAQQIADVEAHDITFSLPDSPGSIAEIHDFFRMPGIANRIVTFVDAEKNNGYSNLSLLQLQSTATSPIQVYKPCNLPGCVIDCARAMVHRLQEVLYMGGRR